MRFFLVTFDCDIFGGLTVYKHFCLGLRKSLFNVFQHGNCHPKMALVIDDRLKVWDEKDQPRVHVVPAFAPYYAPQAEVCTGNYCILYVTLLYASYCYLFKVN